MYAAHLSDSAYLKVIKDKINLSYVIDNSDSLVYYGLKLYDLAIKMNSSPEKEMSLRYMLEGYMLTGDLKAADQVLQGLRDFANRFSRPIRDDLKPDQYQYYSAFFSYYYFKSKLDLLHNRPQQALISIDSVLNFINTHDEYYLNYRPGHGRKSELKQTRLVQALIIKGDILLYQHDHEKAYLSYVNAFHHGRYADSIDALKYKEDWGRQRSALLALINLAVQTNQTGRVEQWMKQFPNLTTTTRFYNRAQKSIYVSTLTNLSKENQSANNMILFLKTAQQTRLDPNVRLEIIEFYLRTKNYVKATIELNEYKKLIKPDLESIISKVGYQLASAECSASMHHTTTMQIHISRVLDLLKESNLGEEKNYINDLQIKAFKKLTSIYRIIFEKDHNVQHLHHIVNIGKETYPVLSRWRYHKERGDDHSLILKEFKNFILEVMDAMYLLSTKDLPIDRDLLLNYIELNKSFNLQNERQLRINQLTDHLKREYEELMIEIRNIEEQVNESSSIDPALSHREISLKSRRREILDSTELPPFPLLSMSSVQSRLTTNQSIIEFLFGQQHLYILKIDRTGYKFIRNDLRYNHLGDNIKDNIAEFLKLLDSGDEFSRNKKDSVWAALSFNLYLNTLGSFNLLDSQKLIIIPDEALNFVPFSALLTSPVQNNKYRSWPYLFKKHPISMQHSTRFWLEQNFNTSNTSQSDNISLYSPALKDLVYHQKECQHLAQLFKRTHRINPAISNVSQLAFQSLKSKILHIASHAHSDPSSETKTFIKAEKDSLFAHDLAYEVFSHDLVFLSACETGKGAILPEEGVYSLARSFLKAGARSVISTLWNINDLVSSEQVIEIYNHLAEGFSKDEAIRKMQLKYTTSEEIPGRLAAPYYWAAYQCQGDLRPLNDLTKTTILERHLLSITLGLCFGFLAFLKFLLSRFNIRK